jgi:hypothetical protein
MADFFKSCFCVMRHCVCVYWALDFVLFLVLFFVLVLWEREFARVSCGCCSDHDHAIQHLLAMFNVELECSTKFSMEHAATAAAAHCHCAACC